MATLQSLLVERGVATMRQVEEAMAKQVLYGGDLASYVLEQVGREKEGALNEALGVHLGLGASEPGPLPQASAQASQVVSGELALRHVFYPLALEARALVVAVAAPLPEEVEGDLFFVLGVPTRQLAVSRIRIRQALARTYGIPLDPREQRLLARAEGQPGVSPSVPPPAPAMAPPSLRSMAHEASAPAATAPSPAAHAAGGAGAEAAHAAAWPAATRGLLRWMQRASVAPAVPRRRRRGPMSMAECEEGLVQAQTGEEVLRIFFDFAQQYAAYSALFVVHSDLAEGRDAYGPGADRERVAGIGVPLDLPSCLAHARNRGAPVCVGLAHEGLDVSLASDLGRSPRGTVVVVPVLVRQRCVALLYADDGESPLELAHAAEVISAASLTGAALERLAVNRKRKRSPEGQPAAPQGVSRKTTISGMAVPNFSESALTASHNRQQKAQALARALGIQDDLPRPVVPPPTLASPSLTDDSNPFRRITASFQNVSPRPPAVEDAPATVLAVPQPRPSPNRPTTTFVHDASAASRGDGAEAPEIQTGELDDDELVRAALSEMLANNPAPASERSSYHPPAQPPSERQQVALPSIIVDLGEEQTRLVERLVSSEGDDDELLSEVLREGVRLVPALLMRMPGPLRVPIASLLKGEVRPSQAGPLLRALASLRRTALPFVVVQSGNTQPSSRLHATLLLGEFPYPEAAHGLLPRLFDAEATVAQAALTSARLLRSTPSVFDQLTGELRRIAASSNEPVDRRTSATRYLDQLTAP